MIRIRTITDRARRDAADAARAAGIPDREPDPQTDLALLDLRYWGGPLLTVLQLPRKVAVVARDEDGNIVFRGTAKQMLHAMADRLPRRLGMRNLA